MCQLDIFTVQGMSSGGGVPVSKIYHGFLCSRGLIYSHIIVRKVSVEIDCYKYI